MANWNRLNPFTRRESHDPATIRTYQVLTLVTWLLSVVVSVYYTLHDPEHGHRVPKHGHRVPKDNLHIHRRIWRQNYEIPTAFTMNYVLGSIYWVALFTFQFNYITYLFSSNTAHVHAAASVGSHFIANNLLHFGFVMLFVRSHFAWAEVILIVNFVNLTSLYFRHNTYARFIHTPVVSAPLAWTFVAIYWNGALMVPHPEALVARIFANIFIWAILAYGLFFIVIYKDYTIGFALSVLAAAIGVAQFKAKTVALQWIFAFVIMSVLFVVTLVVAVPAWSGREFSWRGPANTDAERAPLLNEE